MFCFMQYEQSFKKKILSWKKKEKKTPILVIYITFLSKEVT